MSATKILYVCESCHESWSEGCGYPDPSYLRVSPTGRWLCDNCWQDDRETHRRKWTSAKPPPEYLPAKPSRKAAEPPEMNPDIKAQIEAALEECANDLEAELEAHYAPTKHYPSELRRYERDMEPVKRARQVLSLLRSVKDEPSEGEKKLASALERIADLTRFDPKGVILYDIANEAHENWKARRSALLAARKAREA